MKPITAHHMARTFLFLLLFAAASATAAGQTERTALRGGDGPPVRLGEALHAIIQPAEGPKGAKLRQWLGQQALRRLPVRVARSRT